MIFIIPLFAPRPSPPPSPPPSLLLPARADAKLKVVTTIETLADLTRLRSAATAFDVTPLGGAATRIRTSSQAKPSLVLMLNRADALVSRRAGPGDRLP